MYQKAIESAFADIRRELARHGWTVETIWHESFGEGELFFVTIEGEIYTFLNEKTGGVGGYLTEAMWLHDNLYELAPETTEIVIIDTGEGIDQRAHILVVLTPGG